MKSKNILKENRIPKDRRLGRIDKQPTNGNTDSNADKYRSSFGEAKYRTQYGVRTATVELLDGSKRVATYSNITKQWYGNAEMIPSWHKTAVEGYYG